jgi:hypothetical protein
MIAKLVGPNGPRAARVANGSAHGGHTC